MEIVAFDTDDKADGSGKAKITWISKDLLKTTKNMNSENTTEGGWEQSIARNYLKTTIKPLIPQTVRDAIVPVTKVSSTWASNAVAVNGQSTTDDVWIPSNHEVGDGNSYESTGAVYSGKFTNDASRIKKWKGSARGWWLRSSFNSVSFCYVNESGDVEFNFASRWSGVALGFCT